MKKWYKELFENFGLAYDSENFTKGTLGECDFIEQEAAYNKNIKILDIGCGTGRHTIELSKRGYQVTGIDLSDDMLKRAKIKAKNADLIIDFQKQDARNLSFNSEFDLVIMLCEGGFPLMETDEMNFQILKNAKNALTEEGKLIFTTLNGLFPLFHSVNEFLNKEIEDGITSYGVNNFDLMTFRDFSTIKITDDSGIEKEINCNERYYVPSEITWLLKSLGFKRVDIFGATLGAFSRDDLLKTTDYEMLVVADFFNEE